MEGGIDDTGVSMSVNRSNSAPSAGQAVTGLCPIFDLLNRDLWWWSSAFLTLRSEQNSLFIIYIIYSAIFIYLPALRRHPTLIDRSPG